MQVKTSFLQIVIYTHFFPSFIVNIFILLTISAQSVLQYVVYNSSLTTLFGPL